MTLTTRKIALGVGSVLVAVGITAAAIAASPQNTSQGPRPFSGRMGGPGGMGMLRRFGSQLGLTDAQKDQIKTIMQSHRDELQGLGQRAADARQALHQAELTDPVDEGAIRDKSTALAAVEADLAVSRAHIRSEVFQVLTPDQQAKAKQLAAQMQQRMQNRRQWMGRRQNDGK